MERKKAALRRAAETIRLQMGLLDEPTESAIRAGMKLFLDRMPASKWMSRRQNIVEQLNKMGQGVDLAESASLRIRDDEIGWYLFLCEQALENPACLEVSQAQRALPFIAAVGERIKYLSRVEGLNRKIDHTLSRYKSDPDGALFEILVALAYAEFGWDVILVEEGPPKKTPDMHIRKGRREFAVECKRQSRYSSYSESERQSFLRLWDTARPVLMEKRQWVWCRGTFHVELDTLPGNFLAEIFAQKLPLQTTVATIHESDEATISARIIDVQSVKKHFDENWVKQDSFAFRCVLGRDWAPSGAAASVCFLGEQNEVIGCEVSTLGTWINQVKWACGFTRYVDADESLAKKARDIKSLVARAVEQVPSDIPSIIHVAAETLEGHEVERMRTDRVRDSLTAFEFGKPVEAVRFHRFQSHESHSKLYEFDETVEDFIRSGEMPGDMPIGVVAPRRVATREGTHWDG